MSERRRVVVQGPEIPPQANLLMADPYPPTGPQQATTISEVADARFLLTLEIPASRQRAAVPLFQAIIENPKLNEPVRLVGQGSAVNRDMVPVICRLRLLSGSAAGFVDAKLSLRMRRRRLTNSEGR